MKLSSDSRAALPFHYHYLTVLWTVIAICCASLLPPDALSQVQGWPLPDSPQMSYLPFPSGSGDAPDPLIPFAPVAIPVPGPRTCDTIPFSSSMLPCMLPPIPNLEFGWLYTFGKEVSTGCATADYLLPLFSRQTSILFAEAHGEYQDYWKKPAGGSTIIHHRFCLQLVHSL